MKKTISQMKAKLSLAILGLLFSTTLFAQITNTFDGIVGDCDAVRFCASNFPPLTNVVGVYDAETNTLLNFGDVENGEYCYEINTCVRQFRLIGLISNPSPVDPIFDITTPGAPPFVISASPTGLDLGGNPFVFSEETSLSTTRCIQDGDVFVKSVTRIDPGINFGIGTFILYTYNAFGPDIRIFVYANNYSESQTYFVNLRASSAFCGDEASGFFIVNVTPFSGRPGGDTEVNFVSSNYLPSGLSETEMQAFLQEIGEEELENIIAQSLGAYDFEEEISVEIIDAPITFPNPTTGPLTVAYGPFTPRQLRLIDVNGRELQSLNAGQIPSEQLKMDLSSYPSGLYFLETIDANNERHVERIQLNR